MLKIPRTTKALTNTEVKNAKPKTKVYDLPDGDGLQLRIKPNGSKIWQLTYSRHHTKKRTSISLGAFPAASMAEARVKRKDAWVLLAKNTE